MRGDLRSDSYVLLASCSEYDKRRTYRPVELQQLRCLPACLRKIDKLFTGITAIEAVFSDVGPRKLSSRSCADSVSMLSKTRTFLSALPEEDDAHVPMSGCDRRNLW